MAASSCASSSPSASLGGGPSVAGRRQRGHSLRAPLRARGLRAPRLTPWTGRRPAGAPRRRAPSAVAGDRGRPSHRGASLGDRVPGLVRPLAGDGARRGPARRRQGRRASLPRPLLRDRRRRSGVRSLRSPSGSSPRPATPGRERERETPRPSRSSPSRAAGAAAPATGAHWSGRARGGGNRLRCARGVPRNRRLLPSRAPSRPLPFRRVLGPVVDMDSTAAKGAAEGTAGSPPRGRSSSRASRRRRRRRGRQRRRRSPCLLLLLRGFGHARSSRDHALLHLWRRVCPRGRRYVVRGGAEGKKRKRKRRERERKRRRRRRDGVVRLGLARARRRGSAFYRRPLRLFGLFFLALFARRRDCGPRRGSRREHAGVWRGLLEEGGEAGGAAAAVVVAAHATTARVRLCDAARAARVAAASSSPPTAASPDPRPGLPTPAGELHLRGRDLGRRGGPGAPGRDRDARGSHCWRSSRGPPPAPARPLPRARRGRGRGRSRSSRSGSRSPPSSRSRTKRRASRCSNAAAAGRTAAAAARPRLDLDLRDARARRDLPPRRLAPRGQRHTRGRPRRWGRQVAKAQVVPLADLSPPPPARELGPLLGLMRRRQQQQR